MTVWITQNGRTFEYRPPRTKTFAEPPAQTLNEQSDIQEIQRNVVAHNRVVPIVYGHAQVGGHPFAIDFTDGIFTVGYVICLGEIDSFVKILADGDAMPHSVAVNTYTGTPSQTADPLLAAAIDNYTDDLPGIAYVVLQFGEEFETWPRIVAEVYGKKVFNPATGLTEFSKTPALHLGDLLSSTEYGGGWTVDEASLQTAQSANENTTGVMLAEDGSRVLLEDGSLILLEDDGTTNEARRESFMVIDQPRPVEDWVETLRAYASVFLVWRGDTAYLIPDRPASVAETFGPSDIVDGSLSVRKKDSSNLPTAMQVLYTNTDKEEWRERRAEEVSISGVQRRLSTVRMPGVTRHSQARRDAVERLNKLTLSDLEVGFITFDKGLAIEAGDVIEVSHPIGLTSKKLRVIQDPEQVSPGRWGIVGQEYDPAAYDDQVIGQPSTPDTNLPANAPPAAVASITLSETTYQLQNGKYASRIDISWTASPSPFVIGYAVKVTSGAAVVWSTVVDSLSVSTSPLQELVPYTVEVRPQTTLFTGEANTETITIIGKTAIPDAPASLNGFEAGGEVRLSWPASTDIDAERYEIRYGSTGGTWETANELDIVDGLRLVSRDVPEGTWRFYVKTIDSVRQYSPDAATIDLEVTLDDDAFTAASSVPLEGDFAAMTDMHEAFESRLSEYATYYADSGESWNDLFPNAMNTYTDAMASYQTISGTSVYVSPELDLVSDKSGNFKVTFDIADFGSTVTRELGTKPDGGSYTYDTQLSKQDTARFTRARASSSGPFAVSGDKGSHRVGIVAREETGTATSLSSGAATVTLSKQYAAARSITLTPQGTAARTAVFDNIVLDSGGFTEFDVYIFDSSGSQVATDFRYSFKGV